MHKQVATVSDIWTETPKWTDRDWREELEYWNNSELVEAYTRANSTNPATYNTAERNAEALETFRHARWCMHQELMERMSPENWGNKWWLRGNRMGK